jgi:hypothetical protein
MSTTRAGEVEAADHSQFNIDRTYPGRWTITFNNPPINMFVPTTIVEFHSLLYGENSRSVSIRFTIVCSELKEILLHVEFLPRVFGGRSLVGI